MCPTQPRHPKGPVNDPPPGRELGALTAGPSFQAWASGASRRGAQRGQQRAAAARERTRPRSAALHLPPPMGRAGPRPDSRPCKAQGLKRVTCVQTRVTVFRAVSLSWPPKPWSRHSRDGGSHLSGKKSQPGAGDAGRSSGWVGSGGWDPAMSAPRCPGRSTHAG